MRGPFINELLNEKESAITITEWVPSMLTACRILVATRRDLYKGALAVLSNLAESTGSIEMYWHAVPISASGLLANSIIFTATAGRLGSVAQKFRRLFIFSSSN